MPRVLQQGQGKEELLEVVGSRAALWVTAAAALLESCTRAGPGPSCRRGWECNMCCPGLEQAVLGAIQSIAGAVPTELATTNWWIPTHGLDPIS